MNNRDSLKARRLQAEVSKPSPLSFDEAQARLPELVMAELAGEEVDTLYADVFTAFNHYPALVDQYELLLEEMRSDLADPTPVTPLAKTPHFTPVTQQSTSGIVLRHLGEQLRGFLIQLMPRPLPEPSFGHLSDDVLAYMSESVPDRPSSGDQSKPSMRPRPVQVIAELETIASNSWELVVVVIPSSATTWQATAILGDAELPIIAHDQYETRFGPLSAVPAEPITLICRPTTD